MHNLRKYELFLLYNMKKISIILSCVFCLSMFSLRAEDRFTLDRGVNIAHWLSQSGKRGAERTAYFTEKDVRFIASKGFDHIRIPIDEEQMFTEKGAKDPEAFALLHDAIGWAMKYKLRVIVDLHILRSHHFNSSQTRTLFTDREAQERFYECWRQLSGELSEYPVSMVAYELMNEPVANDPEDWNKIMIACFRAVRWLEQDRVIIVGSNRWQSFDTVRYLRVPENDPNIIISFHYYQPFLLTHYEASWNEQKYYHGPVHYPGVVLSDEECPADFKKQMARFIGQNYDKERFRHDFGLAVDAAAKLGLRIYCGEYGCLNSAPEADRLSWHRDIESVFDEMGIARALWCYKEGPIGFGIFKDDKKDKTLLKAMNLR